MKIIAGKHNIARVYSDTCDGAALAAIVCTLHNKRNDDRIPIAVDLLDGAESLESFVHPERAVYIFGSEGETLPKSIVDRCKIKLVIPSNGCLNLAASVNVILYDRRAKEIRSHA